MDFYKPLKRSFYVRKSSILVIVATWCCIIFSVEACHSGKSKHPKPIVARMMIRVRFVSVDIDEDEDETEGIDLCADKALTGYSSSLREYFLSNRYLMEVLEDGEEENFATMINRLHNLWICNRYYPICDKFTWCIYCENVPELKRMRLC